MKLIVGLGNPGEEYKNTRHNMGWQIADRLRTMAGGEEWREENKFQAVVSKLLSVDVLIAKPMTFMNESGMAVSKIANFYKIEPDNIYVIHDDLDIKLGDYKIQLGKGPKDHNGLKSIYEKLGTNAFWHVRVGIENREMNGTSKISGENYVLQNFSETEKSLINDVMDKAVSEMLGLLNIKT